MAMTTKPINKTSTVKAVDGLGNSVRDYIFNHAENKFEHKDDLVHVSSSELKVGSPAHRRKHPERYGYNYTSNLDRALYPKAGTAPSEKKAMEDYLIKSPTKKQHEKAFSMGRALLKVPEAEKNKMANEWMHGGGRDPKGRSLDEEIKLGKQEWLKKQKVLSENGAVKYDKNGYPDRATPKQIGALAERLEEHRQITGSDGRYDKPKPKKINAYANAKIEIPTINYSLFRNPKHDVRDAALEKMRAYAFKPANNSDANNGIGSFRKTIGRKLRAATSRSDWEKSNRRTYK